MSVAVLVIQLREKTHLHAFLFHFYIHDLLQYGVFQDIVDSPRGIVSTVGLTIPHTYLPGYVFITHSRNSWKIVVLVVLHARRIMGHSRTSKAIGTNSFHSIQKLFVCFVPIRHICLIAEKSIVIFWHKSAKMLQHPQPTKARIKYTNFTFRFHRSILTQYQNEHEAR